MNYQDFTEDSEGKAGKGWSHSENIAEIILIFKRKNETIVYITSYSNCFKLPKLKSQDKMINA